MLAILGQIRDGVSRPGQLRRAVAGMTTKVLNERLERLVEYGLLEKTTYPERPPRVECRLTPLGERLLEVVVEVGRLLEAHAAEPAGSRHGLVPGQDDTGGTEHVG